VKINAPWYKKENYDADGNVKTTTSVPIRVQSKTAQKESNSDSDPSIVSDANNLDPSALRSNYKFSIDVNKDSPIKMIQCAYQRFFFRSSPFLGIRIRIWCVS
jgi:hypothetical protein